MKISRPLWIEGAFLSPQQFQQQARWEALTNDCIAHIGFVHPWGIDQIEFDLDALRVNRLKIQHLRARMQDGCFIDTDRADRLPPACDLDQYLPMDLQQVDVLLALPLEHGNGGNYIQEDEVSQRPVRYQQEWASVQDIFGNEQESVAVERYSLTLRFSIDNNDEYLTYPIARLVRNGQLWLIDDKFIPPLLSFSAHPALIEQLDILTIQLRAKRARLMGMRRENNQRMADFAVADVSLFWLLNALNSYEPILDFFGSFSKIHPEIIYRELTKFAGSLLTFSLDHDLNSIPQYQHNNLSEVFPPLMRLISDLLEASLPSRVIAIELEKTNNNFWKGNLHDPRLRENVDFYLSVRSPLAPHTLQEQFPLVCKVGAPDDVNNIVNIAVNGVPITPLRHVPAAIPLRLENQYFSIDLDNNAAKAMLDAGLCIFYVPGTIPDVKLELFAVLRS